MPLHDPIVTIEPMYWLELPDCIYGGNDAADTRLIQTAISKLSHNDLHHLKGTAAMNKMFTFLVEYVRVWGHSNHANYGNLLVLNGITILIWCGLIKYREDLSDWNKLRRIICSDVFHHELSTFDSFLSKEDVLTLHICFHVDFYTCVNNTPKSPVTVERIMCTINSHHEMIPIRQVCYLLDLPLMFCEKRAYSNWLTCIERVINGRSSAAQKLLVLDLVYKKCANLFNECIDRKLVLLVNPTVSELSELMKMAAIEKNLLCFPEDERRMCIMARQLLCRCIPRLIENPMQVLEDLPCCIDASPLFFKVLVDAIRAKLRQLSDSNASDFFSRIVQHMPLRNTLLAPQLACEIFASVYSK
jgi:hypothetical protein